MTLTVVARRVLEAAFVALDWARILIGDVLDVTERVLDGLYRVAA